MPVPRANRSHRAIFSALRNVNEQPCTRRASRNPETSRLRRQTAEHPFGTLKAWMGATHFLTKTLPKVRTEMSLHVLAYTLKRAMKILAVQPLINAMIT